MTIEQLVLMAIFGLMIFLASFVLIVRKAQSFELQAREWGGHQAVNQWKK